MLTVLSARFQHRKADGTYFTFRILDSTVQSTSDGLVIGQTIVVDPQALFHFSKDQLLSGQTLDALTGAVGKPVYGFAYFPAMDGGPFKKGIIYFVVFRQLPPRSETRLPQLAPLALDVVDFKGRLQVPIGVGPQGAIWQPLYRRGHGVGHALVVGNTGSGKSTWMHCALAALLAKNTPEQLQVALVDPKRGEFFFWKDAPHVWRGNAYAYDPLDVAILLEAIVEEMNRRGEQRAQIGARDLESYNTRVAKPLAMLLVVVDEYLDIAKNGSANEALKTIARRGRSEGVFLWLGTQNATAVEGLPGATKAQLSTRFIFRLDTATSARSLGCPGAEAISKNRPGRMFMRIDNSPIEVQAFYLDEQKLAALSQSLASKPEAPATGQGVQISEQERHLLEWAVEDNNGWLTLADIRGHTGMSAREANQLAQSLEERGLAVKDKQNRNKRRVSSQWVAASAKSA